MARRKGSGKGKKIHIDPKNKNEMRALTVLINSERYISRDTLIGVSNKTLVDKWTRAGYLEETKTGFLRATDSFYREARYRTTPAIKTAGSGSPLHSQGVVNALSLLPTSIPFQDKDGERLIQNSQEIKDSFYSWRTGAGRAEYEARDQEIRETWLKAPERTAEAVMEARTQGDGTAYAEALKAHQEALRLSQRAASQESVVSTPDLTVRMTAQEMTDYAETLRGHGESLREWRNRETYSRAADRLDQIASSITGGGRVEIAIEITTENYNGVDIATHETYTDMMGAEVIFLPSR